MPLSVRPSIHPPTHPPTHECLHLSAYLVVLTGDRPLRLCLLHREHLLRHGTRLLPHKYLCGEAADRRRRGSHHGLARRAGRASRTAGLVVVADVVVDVVVALCSPCSPATLHSAPLHPGTSPHHLAPLALPLHPLHRCASQGLPLARLLDRMRESIGLLFLAAEQSFGTYYARASTARLNCRLDPRARLIS